MKVCLWVCVRLCVWVCISVRRYECKSECECCEAGLTVCCRAAIGQRSQINSHAVQTDVELASRYNRAFVLRLQDQTELQILHCRERGAERRREGWEEDRVGRRKKVEERKKNTDLGG